MHKRLLCSGHLTTSLPRHRAVIHVIATDLSGSLAPICHAQALVHSLAQLRHMLLQPTSPAPPPPPWPAATLLTARRHRRCLPNLAPRPRQQPSVRNCFRPGHHTGQSPSTTCPSSIRPPPTPIPAATPRLASPAATVPTAGADNLTVRLSYLD